MKKDRIPDEQRAPKESRFSRRKKYNRTIFKSRAKLYDVWPTPKIGVQTTETFTGNVHSTTDIEIKGIGLKHIFLYILIGMYTTACISDKSKDDRPETESIEILPEVVFSVVDDRPLDFFIESRGIVEPIQKIQLTPRISGFIDHQIIEDGSKVKKGAVLIQFNQQEWELQKKEAYNKYLKAKTDFDVEMKLRGEQAAQNGEGEGYRITTGLADAELAYERAKLNLSYTTLKAPFSGIISTKEVLTNGAYISAGKELGSLINIDKVRIRFDVLESEISSLNVGVPIELKDPSGEIHTGEVVAISPEIDNKTKTGQIIAEVNNAANTLKPGMTVEGRVLVRSVSSKIRMPREALLERDGRTLVFKLNNSEAEWIYVTPVDMTTEWVLVDHPTINPGDTLAVDKHFSISHQQKVSPLIYNPN
jgi:RND family efflux transporter MFP subunit